MTGTTPRKSPLELRRALDRAFMKDPRGARPRARERPGAERSRDPVAAVYHRPRGRINPRIVTLHPPRSKLVWNQVIHLLPDVSTLFLRPGPTAEMSGTRRAFGALED